MVLWPLVGYNLAWSDASGNPGNDVFLLSLPCRALALAIGWILIVLEPALRTLRILDEKPEVFRLRISTGILQVKGESFWGHVSPFFFF